MERIAVCNVWLNENSETRIIGTLRNEKCSRRRKTSKSRRQQRALPDRLMIRHNQQLADYVLCVEVDFSARSEGSVRLASGVEKVGKGQRRSAFVVRCIRRVLETKQKWPLLVSRAKTKRND